MKRFQRWAVLFLLVLICAFPLGAAADDFFDTIDTSVTTDRATGISSLDTKINGARITGSWYDSNLDGDFDEQERLIDQVRIYDRDGSFALASDSDTEISLAPGPRKMQKPFWAFFFRAGLKTQPALPAIRF